MASIQETIYAARRIDEAAYGLRLRLTAAEGDLRSHIGRLAPTVRGSRSGEAAVREVQEAQQQLKAAIAELYSLKTAINNFIADLEK